jgi:hypothetical protein
MFMTVNALKSSRSQECEDVPEARVPPNAQGDLLGASSALNAPIKGWLDLIQFREFQNLAAPNPVRKSTRRNAETALER